MRTAVCSIGCTLIVILALVCLSEFASAKEKGHIAHVGLGLAEVPRLVDHPGDGHNPPRSVGLEAGLISVDRLGVGFGAQIGYLTLGSVGTPGGGSVMPMTAQIYYFPWFGGPTPVLTAGIGNAQGLFGVYRGRSQGQHLRRKPGSGCV